MATQLSLYNGALRIIKITPLATVTDDRPERYALDAAYAEALTYGLELASWAFAARSISLATAATAGAGYARSVTLPTDYIRTITISGSSNYFPPLETYTIHGRTLYTNQATVYLTYVSSDAAYGGDLTKWPTSYARLIEAHLATEIAGESTHASEMIKLARAVFQERLEYARAKDAIVRTVRILSSATEDVYRGALRLLGKRVLETYSDDVIADRIPAAQTQADDEQSMPVRRQSRTVATEAHLRALLDEAWDDAVRGCLQQGLWNWARRTVQIEPSPDLEPSFGYDYCYEKPDDYVRLDAISEDERFRQPMRDFQDEGAYWFADASPLYIAYISAGTDYGFDVAKWPQTFKSFVEHELAYQIAPAAGLGVSRLTDLERRRNQAMRDARSKEAMDQPAKQLPAGRLVSARLGSYGTRRGAWRE